MSQENNQTKGRKRKIALCVAIVVAIAAGVFFFYESHFQSTDDAYVEADIIQVTPKVSGHIVESYIEDNMEVKKGDLVAKIDDEVYVEKYKQAEANYKRALLNQKNAKASLNARDSEVSLAKTDLERYSALYEKGAVSKQVYDKAKTNYEAALAAQVKAKEDVFSDGNNVADADLKALKALRDQAELNLSYPKIKAPQAGVVTNKNVEKGMYDWVAGQRKPDGTSYNPMAAPAQRMVDFCEEQLSEDLPETSYHPGVVSAPLHELLPKGISERLQQAFPAVNLHTMRGYYTNDALLLGVESRTSSPIRMTRDDNYQSPEAPGVFPCGEGAGYSGGIVSSAMDGINCAVAAAKFLRGEAKDSSDIEEAE